MSNLKGRRLAFVEAYINDPKRNQTKAAITAGYSEKTSAQIASKLMKDDNIITAIKEREKELHEQSTARADEVIEFLTAVMRGEEVDNVPLLIGDGEQELTEGAPSAKDRLKAAEMLGKYYALFTDKTHIEGDGVVQIIDNIPRSENNADNTDSS